MIYTIGHRETYLKLFETEKQPHKLGRHLNYMGGSVFRTREAAQAYLDERGKDDYGVFGVEADWDTDTEARPDMPFNDLLADAPLVKLDEFKT